MSSGHVLVVDDSLVNRKLLSHLLQTTGYQVSTAEGGLEALQLVEKSVPDIVLLDIQMPGMSGYDVCQKLKSMPRTRDVPVIFISALDDVHEKVKGFEVGGADYVTKPFEPAEVLVRVGNQASLFRMQKELRERNLELQRRNEQLAMAQQRTERVFGALSEALPGTTLDDTYRLDARIGEGGFGAVFRGMHLRLKRPVAVKVLRPEGTGDGGADLARFKREGIAACRINHPNAVDVIDCGVSSTGVAYLVMELLEGETLADLLVRERGLPDIRCASIGAPVCEALGAAHAAGIIHRDVKPQNIFLHRVADREVVKVVDFGIAKLVDQPADLDATAMSATGALIGTPEYMAPERLFGRPYDERSDIYSVGVMLYLMLAGRMPFLQPVPPSMAEMVQLHRKGRPRPLEEVARPQSDRALLAVVMRALDVEPAGRPSLLELRGALRAAAERR